MLGIARRRLGSGCALGQLMQALRPAAAAAAARTYSAAAKEVSRFDEPLLLPPLLYPWARCSGDAIGKRAASVDSRCCFFFFFFSCGIGWY
jgi:hypothetical protein